ncbi:uncharacterized protein LOC132639648 [Lycium barbarum]|uniref:uncharacterized protein LOC132639648 n=1 Tax=Lycium barbarum TaxID=112863 RepID=UPI00293F0182|nr:uncharacterized protein LOC132639648 [Lycium barbarum]
MIRACLIDFGSHWDQFLPLGEFSYNNSYYSSIDIASFEALYGRKCRSPIGWFDTFEVKPWGTVMLRESLDKVKMIQENLLVAQSRQNKYAERYDGDRSYIIRWNSVQLDKNLSYEEELVAILDSEVCKLRSKEVVTVKVQWKNRPVEEATWETESDMRNKYPHLFTKSGTFSFVSFVSFPLVRSGMNGCSISI